MKTQSVTVDASAVINPPKLLQDKYDKRKPRKRGPYKPRAQNSSGPKPEWMQRINRNSAFSVLKAINELETWPELFQWAIQREDARLCFDILCYLTDRRDGKPFTAINPAASERPTTVNDNRLQIAIGSLPSKQLSKSIELVDNDQTALTQSKSLSTLILSHIK